MWLDVAYLAHYGFQCGEGVIMKNKMKLRVSLNTEKFPDQLSD
jgi:hypothetical protein